MRTVVSVSAKQSGTTITVIRAIRSIRLSVQVLVLLVSTAHTMAMCVSFSVSLTTPLVVFVVWMVPYVRKISQVRTVPSLVRTVRQTKYVWSATERPSVSATTPIIISRPVISRARRLRYARATFLVRKHVAVTVNVQQADVRAMNLDSMLVCSASRRVRVIHFSAPRVVLTASAWRPKHQAPFVFAMMVGTL